MNSDTISRSTWRCSDRTLGHAVCAALFVVMSAHPAYAQDTFPSETIEVVTHAGADGGTDITTRMMLLRARRELKTDMVVVSKKGGGGANAMNYIHSRPRHGYTIMTISTNR
ncbi:MAG: hypothetical protein OEQ39_07140 [Gammaproteobacteria bacterium]|nr:hypothetical protein [Gammaproteobacteria bacterium]MDH3465195.1 hypothetical protein [Gammaproteobacteria bacterium]